MAKKKNNILDNFFVNYGSPNEEKYIDQNLNITQQIYALMEVKGWSQKDLAKVLKKSAAEVSKLLSGTHNFTLRSITRMEVALGADIITTPQRAAKDYKSIEYVKLEVRAMPNRKVSFYTYNDKVLTSQKVVKGLQKMEVA